MLNEEMKGAMYDEDSDSSFEVSNTNSEKSGDEYTSTQLATVVVSQILSQLFKQAFNNLEIKNEVAIGYAQDLGILPRFATCRKTKGNCLCGLDMNLQKHKTSGDGYR